MPYLCTRLRQVRAFSSAGLEHLPYKQRVGGSNPSTPTTEPASPQDGRLFFFFFICFIWAERQGAGFLLCHQNSFRRGRKSNGDVSSCRFFGLCQIVRETCRFVASCFLYIPYFCDFFTHCLSCSEKRQKIKACLRAFSWSFCL